VNIEQNSLNRPLPGAIATRGERAEADAPSPKYWGTETSEKQAIFAAATVHECPTADADCDAVADVPSLNRPSPRRSPAVRRSAGQNRAGGTCKTSRDHRHPQMRKTWLRLIRRGVARGDPEAAGKAAGQRRVLRSIAHALWPVQELIDQAKNAPAELRSAEAEVALLKACSLAIRAIP